jgi:hypothetical protein
MFLVATELTGRALLLVRVVSQLGGVSHSATPASTEFVCFNMLFKTTAQVACRFGG